MGNTGNPIFFLQLNYENNQIMLLVIIIFFTFEVKLSKKQNFQITITNYKENCSLHLGKTSIDIQKIYNLLLNWLLNRISNTIINIQNNWI